MDNSLKDTNLFLLKRSRDLLRRNAEYKETESSAKRIYLSLNDATKSEDSEVCIVTNDLPTTDQLAFVKYLAEHVRKDSSKVYAYAGYKFNYTKNGAITPVQKITRFDRRPFVARYKDNDNKEEVVDVFTGETFACSGKVLKEILSVKQAGTSNEVISVACAELGIPIVCILPKRDWSGQPYRKSSNEVIAVFDTDEHSTVFSYKGWGREKKLEALSIVTEVKAKGPSDPDSVAVIMTTHNRTETAKITIESLVKHLKYPKLHWFIADDRSEPGHVQQLLDKFIELGVKDVYVTETDEEHWGLGASLNNALSAAFKWTNVVLTTEDDWYLQYDFDISEFVDTIKNDQTVGVIRLGAANHIYKYMSEYSDTLSSIDVKKYKADSKKTGRLNSLQVALRHKRLFDSLGMYAENSHPDIVETDMNFRFVNYGFFKILWPSAFYTYDLVCKENPFIHFGESTVGHKYDVDAARCIMPEENGSSAFFRIIIPNYNSGKLVSKCIDSIIDQTFKDFHIIIVDDLSTDGSDDICYEYSKKFPDKITFLRRKTKGFAGGARNTGLAAPVKSEYTWFMDADDWLYGEDALKTAYLSVIDDKPDMLLFPPIYRRGEVDTKQKIRKFDIDAVDNLVASVHRDTKAKIIKSEKVVPFLDCCSRGEDVYQFAAQIDNTTTYKQIDDYLFIHNVRPGSTSRPDKEEIVVQNIEQGLKFKQALEDLKRRVSRQSLKKAIDYRLDNDTFVIVSLTSIPKRIHNVKSVCESMLSQTSKPDKIVLYLCSEDFKDVVLPKDLLEFSKNKLNRFEIRFIDENWTSHTKYIQAFKDFPHDIIINIDDDLIYEKHFIENLIEEYKRDGKPRCVICHFSQEIVRTADSFTVKEGRSTLKRSIMNRPMTGHGTLYPPGLFSNNDIIFDYDTAMALTYKQDEWWLWYVCYLSGIETINTQAYVWKRYTKGQHQVKILDQTGGLYLTVNNKERENSIGKKLFDRITNEKPRICVVATATNDLEYQYKYTNRINEAYCRKHGYDFIFEQCEDTSVKKHYLKKDLILRHLDKYDWVLYLDVDAWFNDFSRKIEDIIDTYAKPDTALIVARHNKAISKTKTSDQDLVNAGVLLVRNSKDTIKLLEDWHFRSDYAKDWLKTRTSLNDQPYLCMSLMFNPDVYNHTVVVEDTVMNYFTNRVPPYKKDTFILHASGINNNKSWRALAPAALKFTVNNNDLSIDVDVHDFR